MSNPRMTVKRLRVMVDALRQHSLACGDDPEFWGYTYITALEGATGWCHAELRKRGVVWEYEAGKGR